MSSPATAGAPPRPDAGRFYITTPIYYVNDVPHIGHASTSILADALARWHRLLGEDVFFLTGTDEHGQKVETAARERGLDTREHVDRMVELWRASFARLGLSYDRFIRTTEPAHLEAVADVLARLERAGDVYTAPYVGWYCVPDERYWTEKDLVNARCPLCGREVQPLEEQDYFFRMSRYQGWLVEHIRANPEFIFPETRRNEVLGFLGQPLNDLCISRPRARIAWGVPLPFDPDYVAYVWVDALINYLTGIGHPRDPANVERLWPADLHLIGKDILTTHAVYWPTLLHAAGFLPPRQIAAHGWWLRDGQKMSKSLGNTISPDELIEAVGLDAMRYYLVRETALGHDANFRWEGFVARLNADLANDLGNVLSRVVNMVERYAGGRVPPPPEPTLDASRALAELAGGAPERAAAAARRLALSQAAEEPMALVRAINRYLEAAAPWKVAKTEGPGAPAVREALGHAAEALRIALVLLSPVIPGFAERGLAALGLPSSEPVGERRRALSITDARWGGMACGSVSLPEPLFPRIDEAAFLRERVSAEPQAVEGRRG